MPTKLFYLCIEGYDIHVSNKGIQTCRLVCVFNFSGILPGDLQLFLETHLPKPKGKNKDILGVSDPKLGASINEALGIICQHVGVVPEVIRGK